MKIAIHGGMAVGKTTLLKKLEKCLPDYEYSYEDLSDIINKVACLNLNKNDYQDFLLNQDLFIKHEIRRYQGLKKQYVLMDYSAEEVAFQTLTFPKVFHPEWSMHHIKRMADSLKPYYVDKILYLDARVKVLKKRKRDDFTRKRSSFDTYINGIHILKREWFKTLDHVTILDTTEMNEEDVLKYAVEWLRESNEN